jgi:glycine/D-amino acid oxidase-like deaminating enzyme
MHYSNEVTASLAWESLKIFKEFEELVGTPSGYTKTGYLLIVSGEDAQPMRENVAMQKNIGINTREVFQDDLSSLCDMVATYEDEYYSWEADSGYADPYLVTTGYASRSRDLGARIQASTKVLSIDVEGGRVKGVVTDNGVVSSDTVIVATGPWSGALLKSVDAGIDLATTGISTPWLKLSGPALSSSPTPIMVNPPTSGRADRSSVTSPIIGWVDRRTLECFNKITWCLMVARSIPASTDFKSAPDQGPVATITVSLETTPLSVTTPLTRPPSTSMDKTFVEACILAPKSRDLEA